MKIVIKRDGKILEQLVDPYDTDNTSMYKDDGMFNKYALLGPLEYDEVNELSNIFSYSSEVETQYSYLHNQANTAQLIATGQVGIIRRLL